MPMIGLDRRLEACTDAQLRHLWDELAPLLQGKVDPLTGKLPVTYQRRYERLRDEFARRGVQLSLW